MQRGVAGWCARQGMTVPGRGAPPRASQLSRGRRYLDIEYQSAERRTSTAACEFHKIVKLKIRSTGFPEAHTGKYVLGGKESAVSDPYPL
ncbi:hypothetical protein Sliba_37550 [Streptomyces nigrescens]|uniref:Uncharacterized protein n=1 Tax=Streptomyces nigrescens TaxID=1920 RepID=A0A640TK53_STRNI|nr:hypothetical protein Sliba_37550 [Streptomyces libani subsp. libani]GGV92634.1 hypothetical protein GCM10010500_26250 [Streptomyces libani subsp. libani]